MTNSEDNVPNTTNVDFSGQSSKTPEQGLFISLFSSTIITHLYRFDKEC